MTFGLSGAAIAGLAVGAAGIGSSLISGSAAQSAANTQAAAANAGVAEQQQQFQALQALLKPYSDAGTQALTAQGNLAGVNGAQAQQTAISGIQNGPLFQGLQKQGENSILQNASATGGLRGGNVQGALAQFSPQLLNQLINQQYSQLGGLTSLGENASAMTGNAGLQSANSISSLLGNAGQAQAGGIIGQANATNNGINSIVGSLGFLNGSGVLGGVGGSGSAGGLF